MLKVRRVLGGRPFAETGQPHVVVADEQLGVTIVGGITGPLQWAGDGTADGVRWFRIGVYDLDGATCHHLHRSRWPVNAIAIHPSLPIAAIGTGDYDGGYAFEGELLLLDLTDGAVASLLLHPRQVLALAWRDDRTLDFALAPPNEYDHPQAHAEGHWCTAVRDDWTSPGPIRPAETEVPTVPFTPEQDADPPESVLEGLSGGRLESRNRVWAVEVLPDGRILAASEEIALECWEPSGRRAFAVPDPAGGCQIQVAPDGGSAWVVLNHGFHETERGSAMRPGSAVRYSLSDGARLSSITPGFSVTLAARADGWAALRGVGQDADVQKTLLISPAGEETGRMKLGWFDPFSHPFAVRRSPELFFLRDKQNKWDESPGKRVARIDPLTCRVTDLFPLEWDTGRNGHLVGGPATYIHDTAGEALIHGGIVHNGRPSPPVDAFIARRALPDGAPAWVFTTDHNVTSLDIAGDTLYAAFTSGKIVALDAVTGAERWSLPLRVGTAPAIALSLTAPSPGRLVLGTTDGRILDCDVL